MAVYYARKAGNVNATDVWATTAGGTAGDFFPSFTNADTLMANGFTVTLNVNTTVLELRTDTANGATTGGLFSLNNGITITANLVAGSTNSCVSFLGNSPNSASVVGSLTGGSGGSASGAVTLGGTGTVNITGNVVAGTGSQSAGVAINANGSVNITGNITGGSSGNCHGLWLNAGGQNVTVVGTVTGGTSASARGILVSVAGATVTVTGTCVGGSTGPGLEVTTSATANITRAKGNGFGNGSVGLSAAVGAAASQSASVRVSELEYGDLGQSPTSGPIIFTDSTSNVAIFYRLSGGKKTLVDNSIAADYPATNNVRSGVSYASGNSTGTLAMPAAGSVALGVPVDNTTGTAVLTSAAAQSACDSALTAFSSGRLSNCATIASVGQQLANALTPP